MLFSKKWLELGHGARKWRSLGRDELLQLQSHDTPSCNFSHAAKQNGASTILVNSKTKSLREPPAPTIGSRKRFARKSPIFARGMKSSSLEIKIPMMP